MLQVFVKTPLGRSVTINVAPCESIENVRAQLRGEEGGQDCLLLWGDTELVREGHLSDYNVQNEATLRLVPRVLSGDRTGMGGNGAYLR